MVTLNRIYTKTGDKGETALGDGTRLPKHALRISCLWHRRRGQCRDRRRAAACRWRSSMRCWRASRTTCSISAPISATPEDGRRGEGRLRIIDSQVDRLEREIDAMNAALKPLNSFVLPGGTEAAAHLHVARAVTRRAERLMVELAEREPINAAAIRYINRLSDHLFVASRFVNDKGAKDVLWVPGEIADVVCVRPRRVRREPIGTAGTAIVMTRDCRPLAS